MPESKKPRQVSFYPVLPLDYLLCDWLAGRACRGGRANDYRLVGWLCVERAVSEHVECSHMSIVFLLLSFVKHGQDLDG